MEGGEGCGQCQGERREELQGPGGSSRLKNTQTCMQMCKSFIIVRFLKNLSIIVLHGVHVDLKITLSSLVA